MIPNSKSLIILLVTCQLISLKSHEQDYSNLSEYSYPIVAKTTTQNEYEQATCFFYKKGSNIYLITNNHVVTGWNPMAKKRDHEILELRVFLPQINSDKFSSYSFYGINATTKIDSFSFLNKPDIFALKIVNKLNANVLIKFINDRIDMNYLVKIPSSLYEFGYSKLGEGTLNNRFNKGTVLKSVYLKNYDSIFNILFIDANSKKFKDTAALFKKLYFLSSPASNSGRSGSPVFGEFQVNNGKKIYKLVGMDFGGADAFNINYVIKGKELLKFLNSLE